MQSKWVEIIAIKTERTQIHFLSDVLVAVASLDLKVPILVRAHNGLKEQPEEHFEFPFILIGKSKVALILNRPIMARTQIWVHGWGPRTSIANRFTQSQSLISCAAQATATRYTHYLKTRHLTSITLNATRVHNIAPGKTKSRSLLESLRIRKLCSGEK